MTETVRDAGVRWFHWINVLCILFMAATGLFILYSSAFEIAGEGKVFLKTLHTWCGYVFVANLFWRLIWAWAGPPNARWRSILAHGNGFAAELKQELQNFRHRRAGKQKVHSAFGRLMITVLLALLMVQAVTGLVLAGTDVYMPPFGAYFANWVTGGDPTLLELLRPGSTEHVIETAWEEMRKFRSPFKDVHEYSFFVLLAAIVIHIAANVVAEIRQATGQISSMFSGRLPEIREEEIE